MRADIVVDATGRNTMFPDWLRAEGCEVPEDESPCGILYFTRHYRLREGQDEPPRDGTPGGGDLGYIKFGVFPADNRHFSVTLATPEIETGLRTAIVQARGVRGHLRATARLRALDRSGPRRAGRPRLCHGQSRKRLAALSQKDGEPQALGFFALGDAAIRTNPLYGRGCSSGMVQAHILRAALDATHRSRRTRQDVARDTWTAIRPYFNSMVKQDLQAIRRAEHERDPRLQAAAQGAHHEKLRRGCDHAGLARRPRGEPRARARVPHGRPSDRVARKTRRFWRAFSQSGPCPNRVKEARGLYPPKFGPERAEMLAVLGLPA